MSLQLAVEIGGRDLFAALPTVVVVVDDICAIASNVDQVITLTGTVRTVVGDFGVNSGVVSIIVYDTDGITPIGLPATASVVNGIFSTTWTLPAGYGYVVY